MSTTLDFTSLSSVSIDSSPSPWTRKSTFLLEDSDLQSADIGQLERFWRIWYTDRRAAAPHLQEVTIVLRAGFHSDSRKISISGINKFLQYFHNYVESSNQKHLVVYLDVWSQHEQGNVRYHIFEHTACLLSIAPLAPSTTPAARQKIRPSLSTPLSNLS